MSSFNRKIPANRDLSLSDFVTPVKSFFEHTTGLSPNISAAHASIHGDFRRIALTRSSVDRFIDAENHHARYGLSNSLQDKIAFLFTPVRRYAAHTFASNAVVAHSGINADNEYARQEKVYQEWREH